MLPNWKQYVFARELGVMQYFSKCQVCETSLQASGKIEDYGMRYRCSCLRCGPFVITKLAIGELERRLETDKAARGRLSYAIRSKTTAESVLDVADNVKGLLETPLPSASQQIDNLLVAISREAGDNRAAKVKRDDVAWSAVIGTVGADDVGYIVAEASKRELIGVFGVMDALQLTAAGWERVEARLIPKNTTKFTATLPSVSRVKPGWVGGLPDQALRDVLNEVYGALDQGYLLLPLMGARTALDRAMFLLVGDPQGGFRGKLEAMKQKGKLDDRGIFNLQPIIDAGNATSHRGWAPAPQMVSTIMEEIEHMLRDWFVRDSAAAAVRAATPIRMVTPKQT